MGQWSNVPLDLLEVIESHLILYNDKVRIRAVCALWSTYLSKMPNHKSKQLPWLLQALDGNTDGSHGLFSPIDKEIYEVDLPEARGKLFKGSSYGWVVTVEDIPSSSPADIYLINPLTHARIELPPRNKFPDVKRYRPDKVDEEYIVFIHDARDADGLMIHPLFAGFDSDESDSDGSDSDVSLQVMDSYFVSRSLTSKVVLSSDPCVDENCMVVAIYGHSDRLAYCKCNDKKWKPLNVGESGIGVQDVIFHEGKLHAINLEGEMLVFENIGASAEAKVTEIESMEPYPWGLAYLAECSDGGLIVVRRSFDFSATIIDNSATIIDNPTNPLPPTKGFKVHKLDSINSSWVEVHNIGDDVLFLGFNSSFTVSSHDLPGYKGNQIYFTDYMFSFDIEKGAEEDSDIGVFNLEDGTIQSIPGFKCHPRFIWPPPLWVNIS